jgi:hypothetical protein
MTRTFDGSAHRSSALPSVWPTAPLDPGAASRRHPATARQQAMSPDVAAYVIAAFTTPGDIVLDPVCTAGAVLCSALQAGRHAVGLAIDSSAWHAARAAVTTAKAHGVAGDGMVLLLDRRRLCPQTAGLTGRVALVLTLVRTTSDHVRGVEEFSARLSACRPLLTPGAHVVVFIPPTRHPRRHVLIDVAAQIVDAGIALRLALAGRCVALTEPARVDSGQAFAVPAHHDVIVLTTDPGERASAVALPPPGPPCLRRQRRQLAATVRAA